MLKLGYIMLTLAMAVILVTGYYAIQKKLNVDKAVRKKRLTLVIIPLILWFSYVFVLSESGFLNNFEMPPRFPLLLIFPLFLFIGVFLSRHRDSNVLHAIPKSWLTYYQTFRIAIESLFVASLPFGILPVQATFEGYNYDIVFASTAPIIAFLAFNKKVISEKVVLAWNYLGLGVIAVIIFLFITTIYFPSFWGSETTLASASLTEFSFMLVPGFLMPSAVFIHIVSIIRLRKSIAESKSKVEMIASI